MANALSISILLIFLCLSAAAAAAARTKLHSINGQDGPFDFEFLPSANDSICKSMVEPQSYVCEEHKVTTQDGYILGLQRMPVARSGKKATKPPVLLQHGLLVDGITWLLNLPNESLAFILADDGYDVWISNSRGTQSSRQHKSLTPNDSAFWEWSWDELVTYDLSATFQYVHDQTGQKFHYVGHSLGTLIALAAFSQQKLFNMLRSAVLLSPIAYLNQTPSVLLKAAADTFLAEVNTLREMYGGIGCAMNNTGTSCATNKSNESAGFAYCCHISFVSQELYWLGLHEFVPEGKAASNLLEDICSKPGINCSDIISLVTGPNCCINSSRTDIFLKHEPQPTATKNMIHLAQMIRTGSIAMYDYGNAIDNMNHYGQPTPPVYNMTSIPKDLPLFLGYGGQDTLSDVKDVQVLLKDLQDHEGDKLVVQYREDYAHADFVFGVNARQVVYDPLMAFFKLN